MQKRTIRSQLALRASLVLLSGLLAQTVTWAQEQRLAIRAGFGQTDNLGRDALDKRSSSFQLVGADVDIVAERPRLEGQLGGGVRWRRYSEEGVLNDDQEILGSLDGRLALDLVPDRFAWDFEENFGQVRTNPLEVDGPRNRQRVTVFSTGPRLNVPLGARTELSLSGRFSDRQFEEAETLDSQNTALQAGVYRQISPISRVGLALLKSESDFDGSAQSYEFENVFLSYDKQLASGAVGARIGSGEVTTGAVSRSTAVMSFSWERDVGTRSRLIISGGKELTDAGQLFRTGGNLGGLTTGGGASRGNLGGFGSQGGRGGGGFGTGIGGLNDERLREIFLAENPLERSTLRFGFNIEGTRTNINISFGGFQNRFEVDDSLDGDGLHTTFSITRDLTQRWDAQVQLRGTYQDFDRLGQDYNDFRGRVSFGRPLGRRATIDLAYVRSTRSGATSSFDENAYTVTFGYELGR